jgi:prepilin-type N-terminal cleavage/methylation domain-containing protein
MKTRNQESGFSLLEVIIVIAAVSAIIISSVYAYHKYKSGTTRNYSTIYTVKGNKILGPNSKPYIPLGVTVFGVSRTNWQSNITGDIAQINASASYWHANMVRIQVSPYYLDSNTPGYLAAVKQEVTTAENDGLNVIISAQYENTKSLAPTAAPVDSTVQFWKTIAPIYASDSRIWFDLFNEPTANRPYSVWKNGGTGSDGNTYVGMQTLVNDIRAVAPNNIIIAECIDWGQHFIGITGYTLDGSNIIYAVHPYLHNTSSVATQPLSYWQNQWSTTFGAFASQYPVLIGEWGEHEGPDLECQTNAPTLVPAFLSYISSLHIGLIGWSLTPGAMIRGTSLTTPNAFDPGVPYECTQANTGVTSQGVGQDMLSYFSSNGIYNH